MPIHVKTIANVTVSKLSIVSEQPTYKQAIGNEIIPITLCATFHVSSSLIVHGSL